MVDIHLNFQGLAAATENMSVLCCSSAHRPPFEVSRLVETTNEMEGSLMYNCLYIIGLHAVQFGNNWMKKI